MSPPTADGGLSGAAQLLIIAVTIVNLVLILRLVRHGKLRAKYSMLWIGVGLLLLPLVLFPPLLDRVSTWVGVHYGPAVIFLAAIVFLFLVVVHFSWELSRLEDRTRTLAEEIALLWAEASLRVIQQPRMPTHDSASALDEPDDRDLHG